MNVGAGPKLTSLLCLGGCLEEIRVVDKFLSRRHAALLVGGSFVGSSFAVGDNHSQEIVKGRPFYVFGRNQTHRAQGCAYSLSVWLLERFEETGKICGLDLFVSSCVNEKTGEVYYPRISTIFKRFQ